MYNLTLQAWCRRSWAEFVFFLTGLQVQCSTHGSIRLTRLFLTKLLDSGVQLCKSNFPAASPSASRWKLRIPHRVSSLCPTRSCLASQLRLVEARLRLS